ncbi:hypothetical protein DL93DRAFT_1564974 [Clavulina sp. PMI_390]|nr:hypothetical protein DL93DRAFT_1564974 [Clavulina sp. PMI_390]
MPCCSEHVMSLLLTCRRWHSVILNLPDFWATIFWDLNNPDMQERYLSAFLRMSRHSPLRISIRFYIHGDFPSVLFAIHIQTALLLLSSHASRIHHLSIVTSERFMRLFLPLKLHLPSLRSLIIEKIKWGDGEVQTLHLRLAEGMAALMSLTIRDPCGFEPLEDARPSSLHYLSLGHVDDLHSYWPFLRACDNLTALEIDLSKLEEPPDGILKPALLMPNLLNLRIVGSLNHFFYYFSELYHLDQLEILGMCRLKVVAQVKRPDSSPVLSLPNLRVCSLDTEDMEGVMSLIEVCPKLEALQIHTIQGISALLKCLSMHDNLSPNLQFVSFWPRVGYQLIQSRLAEVEALCAHEEDLMAIRCILRDRHKLIFELGNTRHGVWRGWWKLSLLDSLVYGIFGGPLSDRFRIVRELPERQSPCGRFSEMLDLDASFWRSSTSSWVTGNRSEASTAPSS